MATSECLTLTSCGRDGIFLNATVCGPYRYELQLTWNDGKKLVAVGLNPPGGDDLKYTSTVRVLMNYARKYRFGGLVILNLYGWKATNPAHLVAASRRGENVVGDNDFYALRERIDRNGGEHVTACWGTLGRKRGLDFLNFLGAEYVAENVKCFGVNRDGSPIHPLHSRLRETLVNLEWLT